MNPRTAQVNEPPPLLVPKGSFFVRLEDRCNHRYSWPSSQHYGMNVSNVTVCKLVRIVRLVKYKVCFHSQSFPGGGDGEAGLGSAALDLQSRLEHPLPGHGTGKERDIPPRSSGMNCGAGVLPGVEAGWRSTSGHGASAGLLRPPTPPQLGLDSALLRSRQLRRRSLRHRRRHQPRMYPRSLDPTYL